MAAARCLLRGCERGARGSCARSACQAWMDCWAFSALRQHCARANARLWKKLWRTSVCLGVVTLGVRGSDAAAAGAAGVGGAADPEAGTAVGRASFMARSTAGRSSVEACIEGPSALRAGVATALGGGTWLSPSSLSLIHI